MGHPGHHFCVSGARVGKRVVSSTEVCGFVPLLPRILHTRVFLLSELVLGSQSDRILHGQQS